MPWPYAEITRVPTCLVVPHTGLRRLWWQRSRAIAILAWLFPLLWAALFLLARLPALMVVIGGVAGMAILLIVVFAVVHFRYRQVPERLAHGRVYDLVLWISILSILAVAVYGILQAGVA